MSDIPYSEKPLWERLYPETQTSTPEQAASQNPHWHELPLSYRLYPDTTWPPVGLAGVQGKGADVERDRLFQAFYEQEKDN